MAAWRDDEVTNWSGEAPNELVAVVLELGDDWDKYEEDDDDEDDDEDEDDDDEDDEDEEDDEQYDDGVVDTDCNCNNFNW